MTLVWEIVGGDSYETLVRLKVQGGWLYRLTRLGNVALAFVPEAAEPEISIEVESVLSDAFAKPVPAITRNSTLDS